MLKDIDWATPRARDWKGDGKDCLPSALEWPTPTKSDANQSGSEGYPTTHQMGTTLTDAIVGPRGGASRSTHGNPRGSSFRPKLNPAWECTLMGFPADWLVSDGDTK